MQLDSSPKDGQGCLGGQDALLTIRRLYRPTIPETGHLF